MIVSASAAIVAMLILLAVFVPLGAPPQMDADLSVKEAGILSTYRKTYSVEGNFLEPVIGPSSPNDPTEEDGRLWVIVGQDTGLIEMNAVASNGTPFVPSEPDVSIRIQDFGLSTPLSNLLYLVPGRLRTGLRDSMDDLTKNGLLAFVANRYLVLLNPFDRRILHKEYIGFQPKWFVQDVVSAGEMYDFPTQMYNETGGLTCDRFIVAANETRLSVFRLNYRSNQDDPVILPDGFQTVMSTSMPVTGLPLAYYLKVQPLRSGLFIPTSNHRLRYFTLNASREHNLTLSIDGDPADLSAPLGFSRSPEMPMLYVSLKSSSRTGVAYLRLTNLYSGDLTVVHTLTIDDANATVATPPDPANLDTPYFAITYYQDGTARRTGLMGGTSDGRPDYSLGANLSRPVRSFFHSPATSQLFALDIDGTVWFVSTSGSHEIKNFFLDSNPERARLLYMGSRTGTKYSLLVIKDEILGFMLEPSTGNATVFELTKPATEPPVNDGRDVLNLVVPVVFAIVAAAAVIATWTLTRPRKDRSPKR